MSQKIIALLNIVNKNGNISDIAYNKYIILQMGMKSEYPNLFQMKSQTFT